ncbi:MAG: hypothetical protein D8M57_13075 [Candidatus Scalindua sp. AMX11]|nr:MAG: hypothetical protein DWQ00_12015 [Candidatus Scalindua sp.]NOG83795.1 hypothetical protein [Planctomycetota bacterium]RZV82951.1 MAG: hypothetical protein EX341_09170 [Candidatus Scalindua sp. SCAELEC01]TDE64427.1 MAG: hypothetical protein D8M57_13075 [Candidatus Scalindua sp. AMX11]GJQ59754.1 MAG: hypothetical protein SCALA701_25550 [Candidatus Scalindua sp.]
MTIRQLKHYLVACIEQAVESPSVSCPVYTLKKMWSMYNDMCDREAARNNYDLIIAETLERNVKKDFPPHKKGGA